MKKRSVFCFIFLTVIMLISSCGPGPAAPALQTPVPTAVSTPPPQLLPLPSLRRLLRLFQLLSRCRLSRLRRVISISALTENRALYSRATWPATAVGLQHVYRLGKVGRQQRYPRPAQRHRLWVIPEREKWMRPGPPSGTRSSTRRALTASTYCLFFRAGLTGTPETTPIPPTPRGTKTSLMRLSGGPAKSPAELFEEGSVTQNRVA